LRSHEQKMDDDEDGPGERKKESILDDERARRVRMRCRAVVLSKEVAWGSTNERTTGFEIGEEDGDRCMNRRRVGVDESSGTGVTSG